MYGGPSSKLGRGGGPKRLRNSFPPPPRHRPPSSANSRLSLGGSANKPPPAVEETFSFVSGNNPPAFSMIIRLAPDLVEEIKRVEAQGGTARMKFDPNPNNPNGNIIDLGGKEFRFTWSRDGDLCDIYEQRQSGVDGNGLLVESGCAWRKVNVQRILDESTKNRVKMRSEEAERKLKSRNYPLKADNADVGSQNNLTEMSTKFRNSESGVSHDIDLDGRRESNRRVPANGSKQGTKRGMVSSPVKESKRRRPNSGEEVPEGRKDSVFVDRSNGDQKKRESSSDENSCSYSKFEKEEPELKGPIRTFSQYKEYAQEYQDKYQSYLSLRKILMDYTDEFNKLGVDLENAERSGNQDRYDGIAAQIMESYRRCGSRHMRLKKIFLVIHEELLSAKQSIKDFADWYRYTDWKYKITIFVR
ncbi:uncharacterized protein LOC123882865 [Trifolium pratense]|uniref:uncharacterized protein LOC123882865 n=1 Tax=Trifolium pratense TaxID=57577 RepID=UPI001E693F54|nr:uncharacterized protein LOC123882865 [Trifolium pratense]